MTEPKRPKSDAVLERLTSLHPKLIDLSLDRTERLLARLGNPETRLPPAIHVAGTNGKGSAIAFMRAIAEAAGLRVHVYTSPHLVRFHERIVLAGTVIDEAALLAVLEECETANAGEPVTFFEITTVAAFLAFSRTPADLLLLETGLGGRFDSTNVIRNPAVTAITPISIDHVQFLGGTLAEIAFEKAGILKPGAPCIVGPQEDAALAVLRQRAAEVGAPLSVYGEDWTVKTAGGTLGDAGGFVYADASGRLDLPDPALPGAHQYANAGTAIAALRAWKHDGFDAATVAAGIRNVRWPARMQHLTHGPLVDALPDGWDLWLDGGHNPAAGAIIAGVLDGWRRAAPGHRPTVLVCAMQENKDAAGFLAPLAASAGRLIAVPMPAGTAGHEPGNIAEAARACGLDATAAPSLADAVVAAAQGPAGRILICGSLYLAGEVLAENG